MRQRPLGALRGAPGRELHCIDASPEALAVAEKNLHAFGNCSFHAASVAALPLADDSMDFGFLLGVLHHTPDPEAGMRACVQELKPGAPFLGYMQYDLDNRGLLYRAAYLGGELIWYSGAQPPPRLRVPASRGLALGLYWPLARAAALAERRGVDVSQWPLSAYRDKDFYTMRADTLDRFTRVVDRYRRGELEAMMKRSGLGDIRFRPEEPYWCAVGSKDPRCLDENRRVRHQARRHRSLPRGAPLASAS
ncbi:MAG: class I SAM-dependent methyltransferase [Myxococcota bacterium]